jgi:hypothetical protein
MKPLKRKYGLQKQPDEPMGHRLQAACDRGVSISDVEEIIWLMHAFFENIHEKKCSRPHVCMLGMYLYACSYICHVVAVFRMTMTMTVSPLVPACWLWVMGHLS